MLRITACSLLACSLAGAQLQVFTRSETAVGVFANDGTKTVLKHKPAGKLVIQERFDVARGNGIVSGMGFRPVLSARGLRMREFCYIDARANAKAAGGSTTATTAVGAKQGKHSWMLSIRGQATSTLTITVGGEVRGNGKASVALDIDADNKIDFTHTINGTTVRKSFANFKGSNPRRVRVTVDGSATASQNENSYDLTFVVMVETPVKNRCFFHRFGRPCSAMTLGAFDQAGTGHDINFNLENGPANAPAILFLGPVRLRARISGVSCPLYTLPAVTLLGRSDASGDAQLNLKLPAIKVSAVPFQGAMIDGQGRIILSNGLLMDCL